MMGYIKLFDGCITDIILHVGWVDAKTGEPVNDKDVGGKYERAIMSRIGVRFFGELLTVPALSRLIPSIRV
jgi:fatty acid synthase subunit alpha, fungi type